MSLFVQMNLTCPSCDAVFTCKAVGSVNADRRPDLRDEILEERFQIIHCSECEHEFRLEPDFNYLDAGRQQWIAALPARQLRDHLEIAAEKQGVFDGTYGKDAPEAAQAIGKDLLQRLVFGWPAMREKLVLQELGFDDVLMEVAKLDLLRILPSAPLREGVELRLAGADAEFLNFIWVEAASEEVLNAFQAPRRLYDDIAKDPEPWVPVRAMLAAGMFVDMQKLFMGEGESANQGEAAA